MPSFDALPPMPKVSMPKVEAPAMPSFGGGGAPELPSFEAPKMPSFGGFGGGGGGGGGSGAALASINELSSAIAPSAASAPVGGFCGGLREAVTMVLRCCRAR